MEQLGDVEVLQMLMHYDQQDEVSFAIERRVVVYSIRSRQPLPLRLGTKQFITPPPAHAR